MKKHMKLLCNVLKINKKNLEFVIVFSILLVVIFKYIGRYDDVAIPSAVFSLIFIPIFVLIISFFINSLLNEEDVIEKRIKQNEFFYENKMITREQYESELNETKKIVQNLHRYKKTLKERKNTKMTEQESKLYQELKDAKNECDQLMEDIYHRRYSSKELKAMYKNLKNKHKDRFAQIKRAKKPLYVEQGFYNSYFGCYEEAIVWGFTEPTNGNLDRMVHSLEEASYKFMKYMDFVEE